MRCSKFVFGKKNKTKKNPSKNALTTRWSPPPNKQVKKWNEKDTVISKLVQRASHSSSHLSIVLLTGLDIWKGMISTSSFSSLQHFLLTVCCKKKKLAPRTLTRYRFLTVGNQFASMVLAKSLRRTKKCPHK